MPKILTVVGARPQFIKAAALSRALKKYGLEEVLVHTGQHFDDNMAEIFFRQMEIPEPKYNLGIHSLSHGAMTGQMLEAVEKVILAEKPSAVVVFGDTNSTLAGALAASKLHIPVAHVEAGLRSYNRRMPEEINRILTDRISDYLFVPTEAAEQNLLREGFGQFDVKIINSGDVMYDVALYYSRISAGRSVILKELPGDKPFILATLHRQENTDDLQRLKSILEAFDELAAGFSIVLPLHPRTKKIMEQHRIKTNFVPLEPVGYFDMVELLKNCAFVITDSGGLQKEAFFFKKQCLIIREETEWTELVDLGYNHIAGSDKHRILEKAEALKNIRPDFKEKPFGDGNAAGKIASVLKEV